MEFRPDDEIVEKVLSKHSPQLRQKLLLLRALIIKTADSLESLGEVIETLKWGQLSFITQKPKTGTTIRIDAVKDNPRQYAMYLNCQTNLLQRFRQMYPQQFTYAGNRAIIFDLDEKIAEKELSHCIALALTYHLKK